MILIQQYSASSKTFFSPSFPAAATKNNFLAFDKGVPFLTLTSLPTVFRSPAIGAREKLLTQIGEWWATVTPEDRKLFAPSLTAMIEVSSAEGLSQRDWASLMITELWALEANAPYGQNSSSTQGMN